MAHMADQSAMVLRPNCPENAVDQSRPHKLQERKRFLVQLVVETTDAREALLRHGEVLLCDTALHCCLRPEHDPYQLDPAGLRR